MLKLVLQLHGLTKITVTHDVVSDTGLFNSGNLNNGMSYNYTFNQTGVYPYHCSIHPSMTGTIVVSKQRLLAAIIRAVLVDHQLDIEENT